MEKFHQRAVRKGRRDEDGGERGERWDMDGEDSETRSNESDFFLNYYSFYVFLLVLPGCCEQSLLRRRYKYKTMNFNR